MVIDGDIRTDINGAQHVRYIKRLMNHGAIVVEASTDSVLRPIYIDRNEEIWCVLGLNNMEELINKLNKKLGNEKKSQAQYNKERNKLKREFKSIFFEKLSPICDNDTYYSNEQCKKLGFDKDHINLWIDTTEEPEEILDSIRYEHYGNFGYLSFHDNDELRLFLDNVDIILRKLIK